MPLYEKNLIIILKKAQSFHLEMNFISNENKSMNMLLDIYLVNLFIYFIFFLFTDKCNIRERNIEWVNCNFLNQVSAFWLVKKFLVELMCYA